MKTLEQQIEELREIPSPTPNSTLAAKAEYEVAKQALEIITSLQQQNQELQSALDSSNQTNQATGKKLQELQGKLEEAICALDDIRSCKNYLEPKWIALQTLKRINGGSDESN